MSQESDKTIDVFGVGNALVDILALVEEDFVREHDLPKGGMMLVDAAQSDALYAKLAEKFAAGVEMSGGSCGNTMAGFASLGGTGAYIGKVHGDRFGTSFSKGMADQGVAFGWRNLTRFGRQPIEPGEPVQCVVRECGRAESFKLDAAVFEGALYGKVGMSGFRQAAG